MSAFEYISTFLSIILGLAVVHLLAGISLILDQRVAAKLSRIHLTWVLNMFVLIMWVWWANWQLEQVESFSRFHYLSIVLFSVSLYLMCGLLFPVRGNEVEDFDAQFELNRKRFFLVGQAVVAAAAINRYVDHVVLDEPHTIERTVTLIVLAAAFAAGSRTADPRYHWALALGFLGLLLRWIATE